MAGELSRLLSEARSEALGTGINKAPGAVAWGFVVWGYQELNLGPHPYQGCALTN